MARSFRDCAQELNLSDEVTRYLAGDLDIDDVTLRSLGEKQRDALNKKYQAELDVVAVAKMDDALKAYRGDTRAAARAFLTMDDMRTGQAGVEQQVSAATSYYMGRLNRIFDEADNRTFIKKLWSDGSVEDTTFSRNMLRELLSEGTGDANAAKAAKLWTEVAEDLRIEFNRAGGFVKKLDDWALPQRHVAAKMLKATKANWTNDTGKLLDWERMGIEPQRQGQYLDDVYDTIVTNGASKTKIEDVTRMGGGKKTANKYREHRQLHFRDADSWLAYSEKYGDGSVVGSMIDHIQGMSRDLGLLKTMGTNPQARFETLKARVNHEQKLNPMERIRGTNNVQAIWDNINGIGFVGNEAAQTFGANTRSLASAAKLGGAFLSSLADPMVQLSSVFYNGTGQVRWAKNWMKSFVGNEMSQARAERMGIMQHRLTEDFIGAARFTDPESTAFARKMSNFVYQAGLLTPWDRANRRAFKFAMIDSITATLESGKPPNDRMAKMFKKYGITDADLKQIKKAADPEEAGLINPMLMKDKQRTKFLSMIESEVSGSVVTPTARTRAITNQGLSTGTFGGEAARFMFQWKSFPLAYAQTQLARQANTLIGKHGDSKGFRAAYLLHQIGTLGIMGSISVQLKEISKGREPISMDENGWAKLFGAGLIQAGAGGLWYDAFFGMLHNGKSPWTLLTPPVAGAFDDLLGRGVFANIDLNEMEKVDLEISEQLGGAVMGALGWVPGQSLWYLRGAYEQMILPAIAEQISERDYKRIKARNRRIEKETGQATLIGPSS